MPYQVEKIGEGQWAIRNMMTNKIVGYSDSKAKAEAAVRARMAAEHGAKMNK